jgi:hypothetical protein
LNPPERERAEAPMKIWPILLGYSNKEPNMQHLLARRKTKKKNMILKICV